MVYTLTDNRGEALDLEVPTTAREIRAADEHRRPLRSGNTRPTVMEKRGARERR